MPANPFELWHDMASRPAYRELSDDEARELRRLYFEEHVAPSDLYRALTNQEKTTIAGRFIHEWTPEAEQMRPTPSPPSLFAKGMKESAVNLGTGLASAAAHPLRTGETLARTAMGVGEAISRVPGLEGKSNLPYAKTMFVDYPKERYGSLEKISQTAATDPLGMLLDVASMAAPVATAARVARLPRFSGALQKIATATDPIQQTRIATSFLTLPVRGPNKTLMREILGFTTTKGGGVIGEAFSPKSPEAFRAGLRGHVDEAGIVDAARAALRRYGDETQAAYKQVMEPLKAQHVNTKIDVTNINQSLLDVMKEFKITPKLTTAGRKTALRIDMSLSPVPLAQRRRVQVAVNEMMKYLKDPSLQTFDHMDTLKQTIWSGGPAKSHSGRILSTFYNSIRESLETQIPGYAEATAPYREAMQTMREMTSELAVNAKKKTNTARSLVNALGDSGYRKTLLGALQKHGSPELSSYLAGSALREWAPKGFMRMYIAARVLVGMVSGTVAPTYLLEALATSPRIIGEIAAAVPKLGAASRAVTHPALTRAVTIPSNQEYNYIPGQGLVPRAAK